MEYLKIILAKILFNFGYFYFTITGITPLYSYRSLRKLYYTSNGEFNRKMSFKIGDNHSPYQFKNKASGILGVYSDNEVNKIVDRLENEGFYKFEEILNSADLKNLLEFSLVTEAKMMPCSNLTFKKYDRNKPEAVKYQFLEKDLINNQVVQKILSDESILKISQTFLGSKPIIDMLSMWWSTSFSKEASSEIAQLYHFDMERI